MQKLSQLINLFRRQPRWRLFAAGAVLIAVASFLLWGRGAKSASSAPNFVARRGPLEISILEGGSLQALESQESKCEVRVGYQGTKILKIVDEGYQVTEEDVQSGKVLVELDSSDLQKQIVQQEIQYQTALASLIDAQQNYEIQLSQNDSDIKAAAQKVRFARMDFDKFLGDTVTDQIIAKVGLDKLAAAAGTNNVELTSHAAAAFASPAAPGLAPTNGGSHPQGLAAALQPAVLRSTNGVGGLAAATVTSNATPTTATDDLAEALESLEPEPVTNDVVVDFSQYAKLEALGDGEAKQKLRQFQDDYQVSQKELGQAKSTLEGTQRLFDKGFVTKTDRERDEIAFENSRLKVQTAQSARDLFLKYDFLRSAEDALSKYAEAVREFDKARRVAISKRAQARARLKSAQGQYQIQLRQRNDLNEQLDKCFIRAKKTGLVVYGGARDDFAYYGNEERIREGATVRERQAIITIPDMTHMAVSVKIHESYIKKVKKGQKARITVDAFPDKVLTGEVSKVGVLPDSQNRWMNPDMKVYLTTITIDGTQDWTKPGMSAKVEILVNKLDDCVFVPVQAVCPDGEKQFCFVDHGLKPERREIQVGEFNDEFIEVKAGVKEGERVLLRPPDGLGPIQPTENQKPSENGKPNGPPNGAPNGAPATAKPTAKPPPLTPAAAPTQTKKA